MKTSKKIVREGFTASGKENNFDSNEKKWKDMAKEIFQPVEHPYQRSMIEVLILLLEVGNLRLLFDCFRILYKAAMMHRSYEEARYWAGQGRVIALAMSEPGLIIEVWIWAADI